MKFAAVIAAIATFAASANAVACGPDESTRLIQLAFVPELPQCQTDSKFVFIPPAAAPTQEQLDFMCASDACTVTLAKLREIGPSDCENTFSNGVTLNVKSILDSYTANCGRRNLRN